MKTNLSLRAQSCSISSMRSNLRAAAGKRWKCTSARKTRRRRGKPSRGRRSSSDVVTLRPANALLKLPPHSSQHRPTSSSLQIQFCTFASGGRRGGNHRGDRDSAFVSSDPLWENVVWPPWPRGSGVCVRAGNHCMMTMPYVIKHKLTLCLRRSTSLLCARAADAEEGSCWRASWWKTFTAPLTPFGNG